jgi:hypothetical protein
MKHFLITAICIAAGISLWIGLDTGVLHKHSDHSVHSVKIFSPDPAVLAFATGPNPYAAPSPPAPWLIPESTDPAIQPGISPATTVLRSKAEPIVVKEGDAWKITFRPNP